MHGQLASFLRRNAIQAVTGVVLIIVTGSAVAFAASGAPLPFTASGAHAHGGSATHSATDTGGDNSQHEANDQAKDNDIEGIVLSVDTSSSFMLKQEDGSTIQISVNAQTTFEGGLHSITDLTNGLRVEVQGTQESGGGIAATKVEGKQDDANDDDDNNNANDQGVSGVIASVDSANERFTLTQQDGTSVTVLVSAQTDFSDGLHGVTDLRAGMHLEVEGARQSDGSIAATHIHDEDNGDNSGDTGGSGNNGSSGGSDGSSSSGSGHDGSGDGQTSHS